MTGRKAYTTGTNGQIHYRDSGVGIPLLLLHQAPMSMRQYDKVFPLLCDRGLRPIALDLPGYGQSDPPDFVPQIADYVPAAIAVLDALEIDSAAVLGHHTGALVAAETALRFPDRVTKLVLNGPLPLSCERREQGLAYVEKHEKGFKAAPDGSHLAAAFRNRMTYANADTDWSLASRYIGEQLTASGPFWYGHNAAFEYDLEPALMRIRHSTLILTNTGDEIYELAKYTHKLRPDFTYREIEGGGIDIVDEKPEAWVELVSQFLLDI